MRFVLLAALLGGLGIGPGCGREATAPVMAPDEHPPVPPASPLSSLVDAATELKLRDDQLAQLRQIDDELGARLAIYDSELRNGEPVPQGDPQPKRGGFDMGGGAGSSSSHPTGELPVNSVQTGPPIVESRTYVLRGETVTRIHRDRARDTRAAIQRVFALLSPAQQTSARRVLTEHGVNPDTGEVTEGSEPGARPADNPLAPIKQDEP